MCPCIYAFIGACACLLVPALAEHDRGDLPTLSWLNKKLRTHHIVKSLCTCAYAYILHG